MNFRFEIGTSVVIVINLSTGIEAGRTKSPGPSGTRGKPLPAVGLPRRSLHRERHFATLASRWAAACQPRGPRPDPMIPSGHRATPFPA